MAKSFSIAFCGFSAYIFMAEEEKMAINPISRIVWWCLQVSPLKNTNWMDSIENIITFQTVKSNSFFQWCLFFGSQLIYIKIFSSHLHPSGTSKKIFSCSALEEAKSAQISERIALCALANADHLQKSFSSAGAGIQGRQSNREDWVTSSCHVHTSLLPHCPILHSWHPMLRDILSM